jgi:Ion channel
MTFSCLPCAAQAVAAAPPDSTAVDAEPSGHDQARGRVGIYVAGGASLLAFCAALAVLDAERSSPDANISDFGDAIWWAVTAMTTVGYGDHLPGNSWRTAGGLRIDDWRHRPAWHGHCHTGILVSRDRGSREGASRGFTGYGPTVGGQDRPTYRREATPPRPSRPAPSTNMCILIRTTRTPFRRHLGRARRGRNL